MSAALQLLSDLRGAGFDVLAQGDRLIVRPMWPRNLPPGRAEHIMAMRDELLRTVRVETFVRELRGEVDRVCQQWPNGGYPEPGLAAFARIDAAERALDTASMNVEHDLDTALQALRRWAELWRTYLREEEG